MLARRLRSKQASTLIHSITDPDRNTLHASDKIADQFIIYYSQLYNLHLQTFMSQDTNTRLQTICSFLQDYSPAPLTMGKAESLDTLLTGEELSLTLSQMKPRKSPAPDGFTVQNYKLFGEVLGKHFLFAFDFLRPHSFSWQILVLPKSGKDATQVF